jgi:superfamily II DNA or RNA helicase
LVSAKGFFFTGFIPHLADNFPVELSDYPATDSILVDLGADLDEIPKTTPGLIEDRDYQAGAAIEALLRLRGQISLPTGTGKTALAARIIANLPKAKVLFVVHTLDLLGQTVEEFATMLKEPIGMVGDQQTIWGRVTVAMIQSLKNHKFEKDRFDVVMIDEAHHTPADTYADLLKKLDAPVRLGFTGTVREDREGWLRSIGLLGPVLYDYTYQQAVKDGWLAQARVRMLKTEVCTETAQASNYREVYNLGIIHNQARNQEIVDAALRFASRKMTCLVQVKETTHGEVLDEMFAGRAAYIHGGNSREQRGRVKDLLKKKKIKIVVVSPIFDEGVDIPNLDAIVVGGGGMSGIKSVQRVGRGLRKTEEKDVVEVVDFMDRSHKYLRKHSTERIKTYKSKGWIVLE